MCIAGRGIFAKYDFEEGDLVIEFYGKRYDDWTQTYDNCKYAVEIKTNEGNLAYIDGCECFLASLFWFISINLVGGIGKLTLLCLIR